MIDTSPTALRARADAKETDAKVYAEFCDEREMAEVFRADAEIFRTLADEKEARSTRSARRAALEEAAEHFEALARDIPLGHENRSRGASTYNWLRAHAAIIRSLIERAPALTESSS